MTAKSDILDSECSANNTQDNYKPIRLIELFAGIGSQAKALERLKIPFESWKVVEFDKYAIKSYNAIHHTNYETSDVTKISAKDLDIHDRDKYDYLLTYSFPCQDISLAGKQKGFTKGSGTRSGLLWEVERLLDECNGELPQYLLMENVPQVISKKNIADFNKWKEKLESLGYKNFLQILNAKDYGIPQNRKRCFMVSTLYDREFKFPEPIELKLKLKDLLEDEVDEKYFLSKKMVEYIQNDNEKWTGNNDKAIINKEIASTLNTGEGHRRCDASNYVSNDVGQNFDLKKPNSRLEKLLSEKEVHENNIVNAYDQINYENDITPAIDTQIQNRLRHYVAVPERERERVETEKVKVVGNYTPSKHEASRIIDPNGLAPTFKENHGTINAVMIKNNTKQGYLEAQVGDGVDISRRIKYHRGTVQKETSLTLKTQMDVGVVVNDTRTNS